MQAAAAWAGHYGPGSNSDVKNRWHIAGIGGGQRHRVQCFGTAAGPLGIVVMGYGCAEHRHQAVADMFVDAAAKTMHLCVGKLEETIEPGLQRLGVDPIGERRKSHDVGKEDRCGTQLGLERLGSLLNSRGGGGQQSAATPAESFTGVVAEPAGWAGRGQSFSAGAAEPPSFFILRLTVRTPHSVSCCQGPAQLNRSGLRDILAHCGSGIWLGLPRRLRVGFLEKPVDCG